MNMKDILHDLSNVLGTVIAASGIDAGTKTQLQSKLDGVKEAAGKLAQSGEAVVETAAADAPQVAGALTGRAVQVAGASAPVVGPALSAVFGPVMQAAVTFAVAHFEASFEAHNKDHLAAAQAAINAMADGAPTPEASAAINAQTKALAPPANADLPA